MAQSLTIRRPDDWHLHLRDGAMLRDVLIHSARQFARAIVMPNLSPAITDRASARAYRERIIEAVPDNLEFTPLMTFYLTDESDGDELAEGAAEGLFTAAKLYPANATTNSSSGVSRIENIYPVLERMEREQIVLSVHGEVVDQQIDIFDREAVFIERHLSAIVARFPALKVVLEHITTADAIDFVRESGANIAATITPHHLHINRNAIFEGGIRPHAYCLPLAKREKHRLALRKAATSGDPSFFLGTDSAPHARAAKESACGCAGIFNAPFALESYLSVFDEEGAIDSFEGFASLYGPAFYGLEANQSRITLEKVDHQVPASLRAGDGEVIPFHAGEMLGWRLIDQDQAEANT